MFKNICILFKAIVIIDVIKYLFIINNIMPIAIKSRDLQGVGLSLASIILLFLLGGYFIGDLINDIKYKVK